MFNEISTGMGYSLPCPDPEDATVELLDGDEVIIPNRYGRSVYSIRQNRIVRQG